MWQIQDTRTHCVADRRYKKCMEIAQVCGRCLFCMQMLQLYGDSTSENSRERTRESTRERTIVYVAHLLRCASPSSINSLHHLLLSILYITFFCPLSLSLALSLTSSTRTHAHMHMRETDNLMHMRETDNLRKESLLSSQSTVKALKRVTERPTKPLAK